MTALGIVYGDIGTSPLYAFKVAVQASGGAASAVGVASLILWALIVVVSIKYALLIMRADNHGEGGVMAMLALIGARDARHRTRKAALLVLGVVGAALLYGDGAITPAISVLSAVEGLEVDAPGLGPVVLPITVAILVALFLVQSKGTGLIGKVFGPVMLAWFASIAMLGTAAIARHPAALGGLDPLRAADFLVHAPLAVSGAVLGAVFLAVTGGEAMYADMGHFGCGPRRRCLTRVAARCHARNRISPSRGPTRSSRVFARGTSSERKMSAAVITTISTPTMPASRFIVGLISGPWLLDSCQCTVGPCGTELGSTAVTDIDERQVNGRPRVEPGRDDDARIGQLTRRRASTSRRLATSRFATMIGPGSALAVGNLHFAPV